MIKEDVFVVKVVQLHGAIVIHLSDSKVRKEFASIVIRNLDYGFRKLKKVEKEGFAVRYVKT